MQDFAGNTVLLPHVGAQVIDFGYSVGPEETRTIIVGKVEASSTGKALLCWSEDRKGLIIWLLDHPEKFVVIPRHEVARG